MSASSVFGDADPCGGGIPQPRPVWSSFGCPQRRLWLEVLPGQIESEPFAKSGHVEAVDRPQGIAAVPAERPFRCLASDREAVDVAAPGQGLDRERRPGCRGAVANRPFIDGFVDVEVDAKSSAVVEDQVPGPIATPGVEAVEPDAHHRPDEMLELLYRHPHIKVRVCSPSSASTAHPPPTTTATPADRRACTID
jgi:hypothetical protein